MKIPRWGLVIGGATLMFFGQIALILLATWLWGTMPGHERPFSDRSIGFQLFVTVIAMPYIETLIGQWLPIRFVRGVLRQPWWLAGLASAIAFTGLHGYTDRAALSIFLGAAVLAAVFVIEARRHGRPVLSTYLTHALANAFVLALRLI